MGSDKNCNGSLDRGTVSIHAPVWGATEGDSSVFDYIKVSIHAPVWGATKVGDKVIDPTVSFNPRSRMGSDLSSI